MSEETDGFKEKLTRVAAKTALVGAVGGAAAGLVASSMSEANTARLEHPEFSRDNPALIVGHQHIPAHIDRRPWPGSPHIVTIRVSEAFLLKLTQTRDAIKNDNKEEVVVSHTEGVDKSVYDQYPDGSEIVLTEAEKTNPN